MRRTSVLGVVVALLATLALVVPGGAARAGTTASATIPQVTGAHAYGAPDGIFLAWDEPSDGRWGGWLIERTTGGTTTELQAPSFGWADRDVAPGQSVTYRVAALGGSDQGPWSTPTTGTRDASGWAPAPGARTLVFSSMDEPLAGVSQHLPVTYDSPEVGRVGSTRTSLGGVVVPRIERPGTYALSRTPGDGELSFHAECSAANGSSPRGSLVVHDIVYGASGGPLTAAADIAYECPEYGTHRVSVRFASAVPAPHVIADADSSATSVVRGEAAQVEVVLRNKGDAAATVTSVSAAMSGAQPAAAQDCAEVVLAPGATCTVQLSFTGAQDPAPTGQYHLTVLALLEGQPAVMGFRTVTLLDPPTAPQVAVRSAAPGIVSLTVDRGALEMGPIRGTRLQRQADDGAWVAVADPAEGYTGVDTDVPPGQHVRYRGAFVLDSGATPWSEPIDVDVPTDARYWVAYGEVVASGSPTDLDPIGLPRTVGGSVTGLAAHPDHRHLVLETWTGSQARLFVTDLLGRQEREVPRALVTQPRYHPHVSPDGRKVVSWTGGPYASVVEVTDLETGATQALVASGQPLGWSPDGRRILLGPGTGADGQTARAGLGWVSVPTGTGPQTVTAIPNTTSVGPSTQTLTARVSTRGDIAWTDSAAGELRVLRAGATEPVTVASSPCAGPPMWSATGDRLLITDVGSWGCEWGTGSHVTAWGDPGTPLAWTRLGLRFHATSSAWLDTRTALPRVTVTPPARTSGSTSIPFAVTDADDPVGAHTATCRVDSAAWVSCASPWRPTRIPTGSHRVEVRVVDPAGGAATASATWSVDATAPTAGTTSLPTSLVGTSTTLRWSGTDTGGAGVVGYDVRSRSTGVGGSFSDYAALASTGVATTSRSVTPKAGGTTCYSVRARDAVGNVGAWSADRCVVTVVDDRSLSRTGGSRATSPGAWKQTLTPLSGTSSSLKLAAVSTRQVGVLVRTCSTCGSLDVWVGSTKVGRISTKSTSTVNRKLIWVPSGALRSGTLTLRPVTSATVHVDGVLVRR